MNNTIVKDADGTVLFNEECGICNSEINYYKKRSKLKFQNCSNLGDKYLKQLHVRLNSDKELVGIDAFIFVWSNTNGFNFLATLVKTPIIYSISKIIYRVVALILFYRFKLKKFFSN
tara:strand:- start:118 stop:468 length:351 start_codon:yes stop_codon:yes gene_type:complete